MSPVVTKDWKDDPDHTTPITAAALEDMETRLGAYTDTTVTASVAAAAVALSEPFVRPVIATLPTTVTVVAVNRIFLMRAVIPKTGRLRDLAIFAGGTQAGSHIGAVYDVGEALAGSVSKLWDSGTVTGLGANGWRVLGDPNLAVTVGQTVHLAFITDSATATFGRVVMGNSPGPWQTLPDGFMPQGNGLAIKPTSGFTIGSLSVSSTITDANMTAPGTAAIPYLIARIS